MAAGMTLANPSPTAARIVVVEDDVAFQDLLDTVLTAEGYTVVRWTQGAGADAFIRDVQPDLVILDLWLEHPQAGSMVLGLLMVDPATRYIPVIICSAYRQLLGDQEAQLRTHGYLILDKPYQMEDLVAQVHTLLGGMQARALGEDTATISAPNIFVRNRIATHYHDQLAATLSAVVGRPLRMEVVTDSSGAGRHP